MCNFVRIEKFHENVCTISRIRVLKVVKQSSVKEFPEEYERNAYARARTPRLPSTQMQRKESSLRAGDLELHLLRAIAPKLRIFQHVEGVAMYPPRVHNARMQQTLRIFSLCEGHGNVPAKCMQ